jgi:class 3 adenylate cyclase
MQRAVGDLPGAGTKPRFRVGLNTGPALVGNIGAVEIRNFSAIGDTTNLAARLQTYAAEGSVVIGASTYELIRDTAQVRPLGAPELKGKSQAVEVYELLGLRE